MFHRINLLFVISMASLGSAGLSLASVSGAFANGTIGTSQPIASSQLIADRQGALNPGIQGIVIAQVPDNTQTDNPQTGNPQINDNAASSRQGDRRDVVLKMGSRGDRVFELQERLQQLGYYQDDPDGIFGEKTRLAVIEFQRQADLIDSGQVSPATFERLRRVTPAPSSSGNILENDTLETSEERAAATSQENQTPDGAIATPSERQGRFWLLATLIATSAVVGFALYKYTRPRIKLVASKLAIAPTSEKSGYSNDTGHENGAGRSVLQNNDQAVITPTVITTSQESESTSTATQPISRIQDLEFSSDIAHSPETVASHTEIAPINETTRLAKVDIVDELVNDLRSSDSTRRRKAIWELGQVGDSKAVQPLVDLMMDSDSSQRSLILASISEIGIRTLKPMNRALLLSLQDHSSDVRKNAIRDVTRVYDLVSQMSELLAHAAGDPDAEVQETAQWALGQLGRIRSVPDMGNGTSLPSKTPEQLSGDV